MPARNPKEPIFDTLMLRRVFHATLVMGAGGLAVFWWLIESGRPVEEARNLLLLLLVLFENIQTFNSRSERHSVFAMKLASNPLLVAGILGAQALHLLAMHIPFIGDVLLIAPVSLWEWASLAMLAASVLLVMEFDKWRDGRKRAGSMPADRR